MKYSRYSRVSRVNGTYGTHAHCKANEQHLDPEVGFSRSLLTALPGYGTDGRDANVHMRNISRQVYIYCFLTTDWQVQVPILLHLI